LVDSFAAILKLPEIIKPATATLVKHGAAVVPALVANAGDRAGWRYRESESHQAWYLRDSDRSDHGKRVAALCTRETCSDTDRPADRHSFDTGIYRPYGD
jgi:hypothetical protein